MGDGYLFGQAGRIEVVRQPLRCLAHGVEVHPVRARADHAAQAAGAEFQIAVKAVRDGVGVARDGDELGFDGVVQIRLGKPAVIEVVCIVHGVSPLSSLGSCGQPQAARLSIILHFYRFCKYQIFVGTTGFSGQPCQTPFIASASLSASAGASELANRLP